MKPILIAAALLAGSATAQTPPLKIVPPIAPDAATAPEQSAFSKTPKEAPPGKLCLLQSPDRCDQSPPQIIREPYRPGEVELYELEKQRPETTPKIMPARPQQK